MDSNHLIIPSLEGFKFHIISLGIRVATSCVAVHHLGSPSGFNLLYTIHSTPIGIETLLCLSSLAFMLLLLCRLNHIASASTVSYSLLMLQATLMMSMFLMTFGRLLTSLKICASMLFISYLLQRLPATIVVLE